MRNIIQLLVLAIILLQTLAGCLPSNRKSLEKGELVRRDSIPFELTAANNIKFITVLNGVDTIDLFFDTGGTDIVMKFSAIKNRTSLLKGKNENYKEESFAPLEELNTLSLSTLSWDSLTIYPAPVGPEETDGHFGWDLFENKIVELNYDRNVMVIHSSLPKVPKGYVKLEIDYIKTLFCVKGDLQVDGKSYSNTYLFDTGFQRAIVLDKDLRAEGKFPQDLPVLKETSLRNSEGKVFVNKVVAIDKICFDGACAKNVPVQLISTPNPARFKVHILGNELLKRFNTILDFQNNFVYLKPNTLMDLPYADAL